MSKWEHPRVQDLANLAFVLMRQKLYDMLHELHMAENYKIVNPEKEQNVYWENFCEIVEFLSRGIEEAVHRGFVDFQSSEKNNL